MLETAALVVVGAGPAGLAAARAYRQAGGVGEVILLGAEDRRPYSRPPLSKELLAGSDPGELDLEEPSWYQENRIDLRVGEPARALRLDQRTLSTARSQIRYDHLVIATGSEPVRPPIDGVEHEGVETLRTLEDAERVVAAATPGARACVVGSGFIACEAASSLAARGVRVALLSRDSVPQEGRIGEHAGRMLVGWLEDAGVEVHLGLGADHIAAADARLSVATARGPIHADLVLLGTGVRPASDLARTGGLRTTDGRISVGPSMRTGAPDVFAAGDVALAHNVTAHRTVAVEHWGDALTQGEVAGRAAAGDAVEWGAVPGFWTTVAGRTLKYSGWGDGWEAIDVDRNAAGTVIRYGRNGQLVGLLAHGRDDVWEASAEMIARGARFRDDARA